MQETPVSQPNDTENKKSNGKNWGSVFRWSILIILIALAVGIFICPPNLNIRFVDSFFTEDLKGDLERLTQAISAPLALIFISLEINQTYDRRKQEEDRAYRELIREEDRAYRELVREEDQKNREQEREEDQKNREQERERDQKNREQERETTVLQNYLQQMTTLLVEKKLAEQKHESVVSLAASALTVAAIKTLSKDGIQQVVNFLKAAGLSGKEKGPELLQNTDLQSLNLVGVDLQQLNLSGANLRDANLGSANLSHAILCYSNLIDAYLRGANLSSTNLRDANLTNANLKNARFRSTIMSDGTIRTDEEEAST